MGRQWLRSHEGESLMNETPSTPPTEPGRGHGTEEPFSWSAGGDKPGSGDETTTGRPGSGKEWLGQLQSMIDNLATNAAPVVREIGAKAAELAALAGEKAGPFAHRAADATAQAGTKVAERGRTVAADLRRDAAKSGSEAGNGSSSATTTASTSGSSFGSATATAPTERRGSVADSPDTLGE
jgi:hypothetical protein